MIPNSDQYYRDLWERHSESFYHSIGSKRGVVTGGGLGKAWGRDNPDGYRAYVTMARYSPLMETHVIQDLYGRERWLNGNGWRVLCMCLGVTMTGGGDTTMREMAERLGVCRQTVSRWIQKLTAWGMIGSSIVRGKYGGLILFARKVGDHLDRCASEARARLGAIRARKFKGTPIQTREVTVSLPTVMKGVPLNPEERDRALADALGLPPKPHGSIKCPAHEDKRASLSFKWSTRLLLHCFAGCTFEEIKGAV